jgi:hypothetical protein
MGLHISPKSKSQIWSLRQGRADLGLMRNRTCPDRQDVFNSVLPQLQRDATDSHRPLFSASFPRNLDERVDQFGEGTALGWGKHPLSSAGVALFVVRAYCQSAKCLSRSRSFQVKSTLHGGTTMLLLLISSSKCSAVVASRVYMKLPSADLRGCLIIPRAP